MRNASDKSCGETLKKLGMFETKVVEKLSKMRNVSDKSCGETLKNEKCFRQKLWRNS